MSGNMSGMSEPARHVESIAALARELGLRVGAAESLTGGAVSSALARGPEAGEWYSGAVVAYAPTVKHDLLGVTPGPLVCDRCAVELASGAARALEADAVVSTTGVGGPGPVEGEPAGTVFVGTWVQGRSTSRRLHLGGDPGEVVEAATEQALGLLLAAMSALSDGRA
jgi:nicotinamide-nucleotide amidase